MAWEVRRNGRRYYYRSRRVHGRVVREYYGCGPVAEAIAAIDEARRAERQAERAVREAQRAADAELDAAAEELHELGALFAEAVMLAAGYHRHDRGSWRRRSGQPKRTNA